MSYGKCKKCGCTETKPCTHPDEGNCWWIDEKHELCSHCGIDSIAEDPATEHPTVKGHKISWLNIPGYVPATWNPIVGCNKVSPGCEHCYAERMANRLTRMLNKPQNPKISDSWVAYSKVISDGHWNGTAEIINSALNIPMKWKQPHAVFVCSMGDLFHESLSFFQIDKVFDCFVWAPIHLFIVLTKRPERMAEYFNFRRDRVQYLFEKSQETNDIIYPKNVWIGVTAENQEEANKRIPILLSIPAAKRFVSIEPMLGPVKLNGCEYVDEYFDAGITTVSNYLTGEVEMIDENNEKAKVILSKLDWVICGGESGPKARPMHPEWVRSIRDQCKDANVPFFFKQWGEWYTHWTDFNGKSVFKMFDSYLRWTQKDWVYPGDACLSLDGKVCETGGDLKVAQYPVAILHKVVRSKAGDLLDSKKYHEWPERGNG